MKTFYFTRYRTYRKSLKRPLKFFLISDLHYSNLVKNLTLRALIDAAKKRISGLIKEVNKCITLLSEK